jgi:hypothetical protein
MKEKINEWQKKCNANPTLRMYHYKVVNTRMQWLKIFLIIVGIISILFIATTVLASAVGVDSPVAIKNGVFTINVNFNVDLTQGMKDYIDSKINQIVNETQ